MSERFSDPLIDGDVGAPPRSSVVDEAYFDRIFDAEQTLKLLRTRPLLGPDRRLVVPRIREVAAMLRELPDDRALVDLLHVAGDYSLDMGHGEAVDRYLRGAAAATRREDYVRERALHLRACRAVARFRGPEAAEGFFDELGTYDNEPCPADWLLTAAEVFPEQSMERLTAAIPLLSSPAQAHDRLDALETLAERLIQGGESEQAVGWLVQAESLALSYEDRGRALVSQAMIAGVWLVDGRREQAMAPLIAAFESAEAAQDDLQLVAQGTVLIACLLEEQRWSDAEGVARKVLAAAEQRGNWLAVADAAMGWSAAFLGRGEAPAAVAVVVRTLFSLRYHGARAASAVLHARLGELRVTLGPEAFDPLFQRLVRALGG